VDVGRFERGRGAVRMTLRRLYKEDTYGTSVWTVSCGKSCLPILVAYYHGIMIVLKRPTLLNISENAVRSLCSRNAGIQSDPCSREDILPILLEACYFTRTDAHVRPGPKMNMEVSSHAPLSSCIVHLSRAPCSWNKRCYSLVCFDNIVGIRSAWDMPIRKLLEYIHTIILCTALVMVNASLLRKMNSKLLEYIDVEVRRLFLLDGRVHRKLVRDPSLIASSAPFRSLEPEIPRDPSHIEAGEMVSKCRRRGATSRRPSETCVSASRRAYELFVKRHAKACAVAYLVER